MDEREEEFVCTLHTSDAKKCESYRQYGQKCCLDTDVVYVEIVCKHRLRATMLPLPDKIIKDDPDFNVLSLEMVPSNIEKEEEPF